MLSFVAVGNQYHHPYQVIIINQFNIYVDGSIILLLYIIMCRVKDKQTNRQTHRPCTVTLAVHARRGLISIYVYRQT